MTSVQLREILSAHGIESRYIPPPEIPNKQGEKVLGQGKIEAKTDYIDANGKPQSIWSNVTWFDRPTLMRWLGY